MLPRLWRKMNPHSLLIEMKIGAATLVRNMENLQKTKNISTYHSTKQLLGISPKNLASYFTNTCAEMFIAGLFEFMGNWKQPKQPIIDE